MLDYRLPQPLTRLRNDEVESVDCHENLRFSRNDKVEALKSFKIMDLQLKAGELLM
ncbi:hypothetical protein [Helicobacter sp.]|uniref:hypothetical protein n=1 Tax=Helicobacter sp. TaxID=218 RepID=UPI002A918ACA|nr:hypothetical protein [Helicobacter sp.]MDY5557431.1 hypothetical protein [Helicobacter sp.]